MFINSYFVAFVSFFQASVLALAYTECERNRPLAVFLMIVGVNPCLFMFIENNFDYTFTIHNRIVILNNDPGKRYTTILVAFGILFSFIIFLDTMLPFTRSVWLGALMSVTYSMISMYKSMEKQANAIYTGMIVQELAYNLAREMRSLSGTGHLRNRYGNSTNFIINGHVAAAAE